MAVRFAALQINGLLPFVYPLRCILKDLNFLRGPYKYCCDWVHYRNATANSDELPLKIFDSISCFYGRFEPAGKLARPYFYQDLWAAKKAYLSGAKVHYDIGSRVDGFIAHCLVFCHVVMLDVRPLDWKIGNLSFVQEDCTNIMKNDIPSNSILFISSLHSIEHFGLGRYGDTIDPLGYRKAIKEIKRVTVVGGDIYVAVPIGKQSFEFNAHRIFDPRYIVRLFEGGQLVEFSAIDDNNEYCEKCQYGYVFK